MNIVEMNIYCELQCGTFNPAGVIAFNLDHIIKIQFYKGIYYRVTLINGDMYYIGPDSYLYILDSWLLK